MLLLTKYIKLEPFRLINEISHKGLELGLWLTAFEDIATLFGTKGKYEYHPQKKKNLDFLNSVLDF